MDTIGFRKTSGSATNTFDAVSVEVSFQEEAEEYTTIDFTRKKEVLAYYYRWDIRFGMLTTAQIDYLNQLVIEENPQIYYNSLYVTVLIDSMDAKWKGGSCVAIAQVKET